jgi:hypothetical protein
MGGGMAGQGMMAGGGAMMGNGGGMDGQDSPIVRLEGMKQSYTNPQKSRFKVSCDMLETCRCRCARVCVYTSLMRDRQKLTPPPAAAGYPRACF